VLANMTEELNPLEPRLLDVNINSSTSEKKWKHWKKSFQTYFAAHAAA